MGYPEAICSWLRVTAGAVALIAACAPALATQEPAHSAELDAMIVKEAQRHGVPERLVRRVVMRESRYNPRARNHKYWGLMQISYPTARSMGFRGTPQELLNPLVNLTYAVPYLANAFIAAGKREDAAVRLYASGYYDTARHLGLLAAMRTADSAPAVGFHDDVQQVAAAEPPPSYGIFGALLNPFDSAPAPAAVAYAAAPSPDAEAATVPAVAAASQPAGSRTSTKRVAADQSKSGGDVDMVATKAGTIEPPKKWMHDGGMTVLARGEQGVERVAAYSGKPAAADYPKSTSRHPRKNAQFASIDTPASAQAYAANPDAPVAPSQSAIADAMTPAAGQAASATAMGTDVKPEPKKKVRRVAAKHRAVVAKTGTKPADASPPEASAAAAPDSAEAIAALRD